MNLTLTSSYLTKCCIINILSTLNDLGFTNILNCIQVVQECQQTEAPRNLTSVNAGGCTELTALPVIISAWLSQLSLPWFRVLFKMPDVHVRNIFCTSTSTLSLFRKD